MPSIIIIGAAAAALVAASAIVGLRYRRARVDQANSTAQSSGLVEAKKNTLRSEMHDLGLGIKQVQGYITAIQDEVENAATMRVDASAALEKAQSLKTQIEAAIDQATTDAQVDGFALGLEEARRHVQNARRIALQHQHDEEDD
ncbi:hypothetical protein BH11CYA1_BH11CYA1_38480 [soil metagenome]